MSKVVGGIVLMGGLLCWGGLAPAHAAVKIESLQGIGVNNDFVVGPGKDELLLNPGQTVTRDITVVNRYGKERDFKLELEDFQGSTDPNNSVQLMGLLKGPYSLKDFIKPEIMDFTLQQADRITIPVTITIPTDTPPGGLYGSVIVSTQDNPEEQATDPNAVQSGLNVKSRIAILYFVRVKGDVNESGALISFTSDHSFYQKGPIKLAYAYKNDGSIYEDPRGYVEVKNLYGTVVDNVPVDPYYVLPAAVRTNKITWDHGFMFGRYKATLFLNRGYGNQIDQKSVVFWVLPLKVVLPALLGLVLLLYIIVWLKKHLRFDFKKPEPPAKQ